MAYSLLYLVFHRCLRLHSSVWLNLSFFLFYFQARTNKHSFIHSFKPCPSGFQEIDSSSPQCQFLDTLFCLLKKLDLDFLSFSFTEKNRTGHARCAPPCNLRTIDPKNALPLLLSRSLGSIILIFYLSGQRIDVWVSVSLYSYLAVLCN